MSKGSDLLVGALENEGVERIFGVPGEENLDVLESLRSSKIKFVVTRHEQAAAFMAAIGTRSGWANIDRRARSTRRWSIGSGIAPMKAKAQMLQSHRDLILNYFRSKKEYSSGIVEGLNTKVKLVTRKAFGYRMFDTVRIALFHTLGRLPEPEHANRFA